MLTASEPNAEVERGAGTPGIGERVRIAIASNACSSKVAIAQAIWRPMAQGTAVTVCTVAVSAVAPMQARLAHEASLMAKVRHEHLAPLLDFRVLRGSSLLGARLRARANHCRRVAATPRSLEQALALGRCLFG